jgi:hypothetical protein
MIERDPRAEPAIISWGAVFAGATSVISVSILLGLLGAALGFGLVDAQSSDPVSTAGWAVGIWTALSLLISLAVGGFVSGYLAGAGGWTHGFLSWSVALVAALVLSAMAVAGTVRAAGSLMGTVASATGSVVSSTAGATGDAISDGVSALVDRIEGEVSLDGLQDDTLDALRASEIEALNPDRIEAEIAGARDDIAAAVDDLRSRPDQFDTIIADLAETLGNRAENLAQDIDRDEAVDAIVANTDIPRDEAEVIVDDAIAAFEDLSATAEAQLAEAEAAIDRARADLAALEDDVRAAADDAASAAARASLWAFFTLLLGALASVGAGVMGRRMRSPYGMGY